MAWLPWPERREKVERFVFLKDRCLSLGAGILCAYALRQAGAHDLTLGYNENDKPYLLNHPNIHFNLSHSERIAACAVSSAPVGIDVEQCQAYDEGVAKLCFTAEERAWLNEQEDTQRAFARLWTRKESYLKLRGCGLSIPPNSFVAMPGIYSQSNLQFFEYHLPRYELCICSEEDILGQAPADAFALRKMPSFESIATEEL